MKYLTIAITLLLCTSTAWGRMGALVVGGGVASAAGGSCTSQEQIYYYTGANYSSGDIDGTKIASFSVTGNGKSLYSVAFRTSGSTGSSTSGVFKILISTNQDFSGTLIDEFYVNTTSSTLTWMSALSTSKPVLANGTTYYVGLYANGATYSQRAILAVKAETGKTWNTVTSIGGTVTASSSGQTLNGDVQVCTN